MSRIQRFRRLPSDVRLGPSITPAQLAARWNMSAGTLKNWRAQGRGPAYVPLSEGERPAIVYLVSDVEAYEKQRRRSA